MTEIYNAFRMLVVLVVVGVVVYFGAQIIPQIQNAATLPARIESDNARLRAEHSAAPTFVALSVQATASAIENERLRAQAEANAQTIAAQGIADAQRGQVNVLQSAVVGVIGISAFLASVVLLAVIVRAVFAARVHQHAIREARAHGGTIELSGGQRVEFPASPTPRQLDTPARPVPSADRTASHSAKRR